MCRAISIEGLARVSAGGLSHDKEGPEHLGERFVLGGTAQATRHHRDTIYSEGVDRTLEAMGLVVLRTPVRAPQANACCERLIGTIRRECVDFVIPMNERHLRAVLRDWCSHYNRGRPHASLGPGIPERPLGDWTGKSTRHRLPDGYRVAARPILGGLHHEYHLEQHAA
jgi:putative transposase